jgi:hypothetical protein
MCRPTTQIERQEALFLLLAIRSGRCFMNPEPWHVWALIELMNEEPHGSRASSVGENIVQPLLLKRSA